MTARLSDRPALRFLVVGLLAALAVAALIAPRVAGQETRTLDLTILFTEESFEVAPAAGNPATNDVFNYRGDILSGQAALYAAADVGGERVGTFYFMAAMTADPEHFEAAANHMYAHGYFELFGEGTLAVTGLVNFAGSYTLTITGGTGSYTGAGGDCVTAPSEEDEPETWTCTVR
jgi:hypothetical protein